MDDLIKRSDVLNDIRVLKEGANAINDFMYKSGFIAGLDAIGCQVSRSNKKRRIYVRPAHDGKKIIIATDKHGGVIFHKIVDRRFD